MTIEKLLKDIEITTNPEERYNLLVDAWDLIVEENDGQRKLVTEEQWSQWKKSKKKIGGMLYFIGNSFVNEGTWDRKNIDAIAQSFLGATRKTEAQLIAEDQGMQKKRNILMRIKRIPR